MTKPFPPRRPAVGGWPALALALGLVATAGLPAARAQGDENAAKKAGSAKSDPKAKDKGKAKSDAADEEAKDDDDAPRRVEPDAPDRYEDPRAAAALGVFQELPAVSSSGADKTLVDQLARGGGNLDLEAINRYIRDRAARLTRKIDIRALIDPSVKGGNPKGLEIAASELMTPLLAPQTANNRTFRQEYVKRLIDAFRPLWKGHLHTRTMAAIVLSEAADPQALPTFTALLNDPEQLVIVKLRAAIGIAKVAQDGRRPVEDAVAIPAARALADFLRREPDAFWPAHFRALEALGSLRLATEQPLQGRAEFAEVALSYLANPKAAPAVRAWAAWTLGMMNIPNAVKGYNLPLVANAMGTAAADIGARIADLPDKELANVARLANFLVQIDLAFTGQEGSRNSGILNAQIPGAAAAQPHLVEVEKRVRAVTRLAVELPNVARAQLKDRRTALRAEVDGLRNLLAKPLNTGRALYTGAAPLADAAAAAAPAAAAPKGAEGGRR